MSTTAIQALHLLGMSYRRLFQASAAQSAATLPTYCLHYLHHKGSVSPSQLADALGVARPNMTRLLAQLQDEGLVEKKPDVSDGRKHLVSLSSQGEQEMKSFDQKHRDGMQSMLDTLSPELQDELIQLATKMTHILDSLH